MSDLQRYSKEDLIKELERREAKSKIPAPLPDEQIKENLFKLKDSAIHSIEQHFNNNDHEDDDHYTWEAVIEAVYGKDVWKWWNKR